MSVGTTLSPLVGSGGEGELDGSLWSKGGHCHANQGENGMPNCSMGTQNTKFFD